MVMCRECGHFVPAIDGAESLTPLRDTCPKCDGRVFKHVPTKTVIRIDDS